MVVENGEVDAEDRLSAFQPEPLTSSWRYHSCKSVTARHLATRDDDGKRYTSKSNIHKGESKLGYEL